MKQANVELNIKHFFFLEIYNKTNIWYNILNGVF